MQLQMVSVASVLEAMGYEMKVHDLTALPNHSLANHCLLVCLLVVAQALGGTDLNGMHAPVFILLDFASRSFFLEREF
jgi:hypothetical protein